MEKQQKNLRKKYLLWAVLALVVVLLAVMPLFAGSREEQSGPQASILTAAAEKKDIDIHLMGGGTLTSEAALDITVPAAVKLTEYYVGNGDTVAEGDAIAGVDRVSVMTAIAQIQDTLDKLAEEIEAVSDDEASSEVIAQAGGTVKVLYAQEGDSVQEVMLQHGALAVLSLDGLMAVNIERSTNLAAGDTVWVKLSDGTETEGKVVSNRDSNLVVTVEDDGYAMGEKVILTTEDGDRIGSGELYIYSQWNAVAYSGTVEDLQVSEGDKVYAGRTLMTLEEPGPAAKYQQLVNRRREYEEMMLELFRMYQTQTLTAPCDGIVTGVDEKGLFMLSAAGQWQITLLANAPNGDDETAYTNFVGQVTAVGIDGYVMKMNIQPFAVTDYTDLSAVPLDPALMTEDIIYSQLAPVYTLSGGEWVQLDAAAVVPGDVLLFAGDSEGRFLWIVRVAQSASSEVPAETQPTESTPSEPEQPSDSSEITLPSDTVVQEGNLPQSGGTMSGMMGGMTEEAEVELYPTETVTVACVTSQEEMTVEITVDELDITKVYLGQTANVTLDALPGESFPATVTHIATGGDNSGGNSKFTVELTLNKSGDMLPGMRAFVAIPLSTAADVLTVPVAALCEDGADTLLYTGYDEETGELTAPVTVTVGISDGETAQILSGIEEGDTFYYAYYDTLEISNVPDMGTSFSFGR